MLNIIRVFYYFMRAVFPSLSDMNFIYGTRVDCTGENSTCGCHSAPSGRQQKQQKQQQQDGLQHAQLTSHGTDMERMRRT
jgi:hypothetical protein